MPVYFAQAGEGGPVKIGWAADVRSRISELQCGCPEILVVPRLIDGDRRSEAWVHRKFAALRFRGEWFRFDPDMLSVEPPEEAAQPVCPYLQHITQAIAESGLTLKEVCARANIAQSTFTRWKANKTGPTLKVYRRIRNALRQPPEVSTNDR